MSKEVNIEKLKFRADKATEYRNFILELKNKVDNGIKHLTIARNIRDFKL